MTEVKLICITWLRGELRGKKESRNIKRRGEERRMLSAVCENLIIGMNYIS